MYHSFVFRQTETASFYTAVILKTSCNKEDEDISGCFVRFRREISQNFAAINRDLFNMKEEKSRSYRKKLESLHGVFYPILFSDCLAS